MIIISGPTGAGKTTTLYSVLNRLNTSGKNLELYRKWFGADPRFPLRPAF